MFAQTNSDCFYHSVSEFFYIMYTAEAQFRIWWELIKLGQYNVYYTGLKNVCVWTGKVMWWRMGYCRAVGSGKVCAWQRKKTFNLYNIEINFYLINSSINITVVIRVIVRAVAVVFTEIIIIISSYISSSTSATTCCWTTVPCVHPPSCLLHVRWGYP